MEKLKKSFRVLKKDLPKKSNLVVLSELTKNVTKQQLHKLFQQTSKYFKDGCIEASTSPFPHCVVQDFLHSSEDNGPATQFVAELREELLKLEFHPKSNDLYKFIQTSELMVKRSASGLDESGYHLQHFISVMRKVMLPWMHDVTGVTLNDDIDMFCAQYSSTDCLLCHDDELERRCFAYVYYLTPDWSELDGGSLDLFDSNLVSNQHEIYIPGKVVKSIVPAANSFVFFEVSPKSFHQEDSSLTKWINPLYFNLVCQGNIQDQFTKDSEIQLNDFLLTEKYEEMNQALSCLQEIDKCWDLCGPPNKCRYDKLVLPQLLPNHCEDVVARPSIDGKCCSEDKNDQTSLVTNVGTAIRTIEDLIELFTSEEMFVFLSNVTGLSFHPMAVDSDDDDDVDEARPTKRKKLAPPGTNSGCRYQLRKWEQGSYTLLSDTDDERGEYALDINLFFKVNDWRVKFGGCTSYIATDEDEELLTVVPERNCLSLAYRDGEALRFVKHVNHTAPGAFYDLSFTFYE